MALSLEWTNWPLFTLGLVRRGYGYADEDVRHLVGGNTMRVFHDVFEQRVP